MTTAWEEQVWCHNRRRLWWVLPLLAVIDAICIRGLYAAATERIILGGRPRRQWVSLGDDPATFWLSVAVNSVALAGCLGVPIWVAIRLTLLASLRDRQAD